MARRKLREYGIAPPQAGSGRRAAVRRTDGGPARKCGSEDTELALRIRLDFVQGAVALQELPRTLRLFQVSLDDPSLRAQRSNPFCHKGSVDCFVASRLAMTAGVY